MTSRRTGWAVFVCCFAFAPSAAGGDDREQLLATAQDGNRAAITSIRTMECRYERVPWAGTTLEQAKKHFYIPAGRFWRSGDAYRFIEPIDDGTTREYVVRNGKGLWLRSGGPLRQPALSRGTLRPVDGVGGAMWEYLLFSHWGWLPPPRASFYTLHEILQHPYTLHAAERLPSGEIHIELSHGGAKRQEFWFDPKVNYLIRKSVLAPAADGGFRWENEVVEFVEPAPAVFVPTTVEHRCFVKGKQEAVIRTLITELKVNHAMPASALRLPGVAGMSCLDLDRDVRYNVDADGNRVGAEKSVKVYRVAPDDNKSGRPLRRGSGLLPSEPPTPWWVWGLVASAVVLAAGLGLGVVRRRGQRRLEEVAQ